MTRECGMGLSSLGNGLQRVGKLGIEMSPVDKESRLVGFKRKIDKQSGNLFFSETQNMSILRI